MSVKDGGWEQAQETVISLAFPEKKEQERRSHNSITD